MHQLLRILSTHVNDFLRGSAAYVRSPEVTFLALTLTFHAILARDDADFLKAAEYVISKNDELYRRLS
jgi:hypothetical protein